MERKGDEPWAQLYEERPYLTLNQWSVADVNGDEAQCGLSGSPTKVKTVQNIVFQAKESKTLTGSDEDVEGLIKELLGEKIICRYTINSYNLVFILQSSLYSKD